jgi:lysophospholipase L1-like esterase
MDNPALETVIGSTSGRMGSTISSRRALRLVRIGLLLFSVCFGFLVAECGLRILGVRAPVSTKGDPLLGLVPAPNQSSVFNFSEYGRVMIKKTNSQGFHEDNEIGPKQPGARRIAFVGDSQTEGLCPDAESFPHVTAAMLNQSRKGGLLAEAVNAGVGRYSPYQYYLRARRDVMPLKPDDLVVVIYLGNDLNDLLRRDDRPYLTIEADGQIRSHGPLWVALGDPNDPPSWFDQSRVVGLTRGVLGPTINYQISRAHMLLLSTRPNGHNTGEILRYMWDVYRLSNVSVNMMTQCLHQQVWFAHFPETLEQSLQLNRQVMAMSKDMCDRAGVRLHYVFLPTKATIEPEDLTPILDKVHVYDPRYTAAGIAEFERTITERMKADAAALGISALDLRPYLKEHGIGLRLYYPEDMHLNVAGNRIVAAAVSAFLERK